ncbi:MAG: GntR family transcriptional regulator [Mogibacterium sp.]|nr:GntR family transcriptional regulator [Mogibacterium sp.]
MDTSIKKNYSLLSDLVYNAIKEAIIKGELEPGKKVSETGLARKLEVSRTPVREALRILHAEGFVSLMPNSKFVVNAFTSDDAQEVLTVRRLLEGEAARLAALSTDSGKAAIIRHQRELVPEYIRYATEHTGEESMDYDIEFHRDVYRMSGNKRLMELGEHIKDRQVRIHLANNWENLNYGKVFTDQHLLILDAIERGDAADAEAKAHDHIDYLISLLGKQA